MVKSPEIRVMSPKMFSQFARNAEFFGSKFIMLWQNRSIRITVCRACFVSSKIIERVILLIHRACFVGNAGLKIEIFTPLVSSYGGPQLSRQNQKPHGKTKKPRGKIKIPHDKTKYFTAKTKYPTAKANNHGKTKAILLLLWSIWFCREVFGFAVRFLFLPWGFRFCREVFCFCHEVFGFAVTIVGHHIIAYKERGMFHIHCACFVSWWLKERDILTHAFYLTKINFVFLCPSPDKIRATWLCISGDLILV